MRIVAGQVKCYLMKFSLFFSFQTLRTIPFRPPFQASDPMKTYTLILKGVDALDIPNRRIGKTATALVKKLCRDNPAERLGCQAGGLDDVRKNRLVSNALFFCTLQFKYELYSLNTKISELSGSLGENDNFGVISTKNA